MTEKKHPHHGHKPHDCDEPEVTPLDVNEPLPGGDDDGGESGGGGTTNPKDPGGK